MGAEVPAGIDLAAATSGEVSGSIVVEVLLMQPSSPTRRPEPTRRSSRGQARERD